MNLRLIDLVKQFEVQLEELKDRLENSRPNFYDSLILSKQIFSKENIINNLNNQIKNSTFENTKEKE